MLHGDQLRVTSPHQDLVGGISFAAPAHHLTHLTAPTALSRTTLALLVSGRMAPDEGEIWLEVAPARAAEPDAESAEVEGSGSDQVDPERPASASDSETKPAESADAGAEPLSASPEETPKAEFSNDITTLRRASALVDSPGITSPEHHMTVRQLVAETLGLQPRPRRRAATIREPLPRKVPLWLEHTRYADSADQRVATLDPLTHLHLQLSLAFSDPHVRIAVLDSPDRHGATITQISDLAQQFCDPTNDTTVLMITAGAQPFHHTEELNP